MNGNLAVRKVPTYRAISIGFNIGVDTYCSIYIMCIVECTQGNLFLFQMVVAHLLFVSEPMSHNNVLYVNNA